MASADLLAKLKDVQLPAEVSWWPLAIGWWLLIALIVALLILLVIACYKRAKKYRMSKLAIRELGSIEESSEKDWLIQLAVLLKRTSLAHFPKKDVASLTQESWIQFLLKTGDNIWDDTSLRLLKDSVYQDINSVSDSHKTSIFRQAKQWLGQLPSGVANV